MRRISCALGCILCLAFAVGAQYDRAATVKGPQEHPAGGHDAAHHKTRPAILRVSSDTASETLRMRIGTLNLPAHTDHMAATQLADVIWTVPFDGWLIAYHPRLVDAHGAPVPGRLLHHVAFWNASRSDFLCPNKEEHIFGAGGEMNDWPALPGFGYRVHKGDRIRVNTMFHNPTAASYPHVWLEVKMEYVPAAADAAQIKSVYPAWFDVQRCGNSGYDLPAGVHVASGDFALKYSGVLLGVGGHMHDYGTRLDLRNESRGEIVASLPATLNEKGEIQSMPIVTFAARGGYPLHAGEKIKVTAQYDNKSGKALPEGAMGIVVGYFLPADDGPMAGFARPGRTPKPREKKN